MPEIRIGDRVIGDGHPAYIIAEIGVNHNGIPELAFQLIDAAVDAGVDAVKFQKRNLEKLYPKKYLDNVNAGEKNLAFLLPILQRVELSDEDFVRLHEYCQKKGITFLCTPFDMDSADFLAGLGVPAFKVASADMINLPLLDHLAAKGLPMILSTGMSRIEEVEVTVEFLKQRGAQFALLHCNSAYPAAFEDINLRFMNQLRRFDVPVGYSGHERGIAISTVAAAIGAHIIERHITLDRTMEGPDHAASLEPVGFKKMVRDIRQVETALGTGEEKFMSRGEILNREVLAKSLVAARDIQPGEKITPEMVTVKGPGQGLSPQMYDQLIGRKAGRAIEEDGLFLPVDIGELVTLDVEHTLPMEWGFVVRHADVEPMLAYKPKILEFHFTDRDLEEEYTNGVLGIGLVVHAPEFWGHNLVDLCTPDERLRQSSIELLQKAIDVTRKMAPFFKGTPKVVVHPGAASLDHPLEDKAALYENLGKSVDALDYEGVELLLENLPAHPWYFGGQWLTNAFMDAHEIIDFLKPRGLKMCYDTSHHKLYCNWAHVDFYDQAEALLPYIAHLHLSDASGLDGEGLQIEEGTIDWVRFFRAFKDYHGTMIPEIWRGHQRGGEGFLIALNRLSEAYFKAIQD
ncbi:MAG: N-acetylneuraminate synthase family protein [Chloroflexi bacterium]|nr:N-acetylneuraminate synthase family protein [Chloroflexota bacterium]